MFSTRPTFKFHSSKRSTNRRDVGLGHDPVELTEIGSAQSQSTREVSCRTLRHVRSPIFEFLSGKEEIPYISQTGKGYHIASASNGAAIEDKVQ